jgi:hypothetical protein
MDELWLHQRWRSASLFRGGVSSVIARTTWHLLPAIALATLVSVCCTTTQTVPPSPTVPPSSSGGVVTVTMYYVEAQRVEPWAPDAGGVMPADWETTLRADLTAAGLHPLAVRQQDVRNTLRDPIICTGCPDGFAAAVTFPESDRSVALQRCFVSDVPNFAATVSDSNTPAAKRVNCRPLVAAP